MALICRTRCIVYIQSTAEPYAVRNTFYYRVCMYATMHTSTHAHQRISHLAQVVHLCITCTDVAHQDHLYIVYTCATQRPLDLSCMPGASEPQRPVRPWPYHFFIIFFLSKTAAGCYSCCEVRLDSGQPKN